MCTGRKIGGPDSFSQYEGNRSAVGPSAALAPLPWEGCVGLIPEGSGGSLFHSMAASSALPDERFSRPKERLEERREEGENDLTEEPAELLLFNTDVKICKGPDVGRLLLPLAFSSFAGEAGWAESGPLNLRPKAEYRLRGRMGLSACIPAEEE